MVKCNPVHSVPSDQLRVEESCWPRLLSIDEIPKSVFSYYTKWSDYIAQDASCRCGFQISFSDITVQHLTVYFASRGGKGNLGKKGKKHSAATRAKMTGRKHSVATRAKMSELRLGKKHSAATRAKIGKGNLGKKGKKHSVATRAKMSELRMGKKQSTATRVKISETKRKNSAATLAKIGRMGKKCSAATRRGW